MSNFLAVLIIGVAFLALVSLGLYVGMRVQSWWFGSEGNPRI